MVVLRKHHNRRRVAALVLGLIPAFVWLPDDTSSPDDDFPEFVVGLFLFTPFAIALIAGGIGLARLLAWRSRPGDGMPRGNGSSAMRR